MFAWFKYRRIANLFKTADVAHRTEIVQHLASDLGPAHALKILRSAILDGSPHVRRAAVHALAEYEEPEAAELLATAVPDEDLDIAREATRALLARNWRPHRSVEKRRMHIAHLIQQSERGPQETRREAMLALAQIDDPLASYEAPDDVIRRVAQEAPPESIAFLMRAARTHGLVAADIVLAIGRILKHHAQSLPTYRLQELADLEDVNEIERYLEPIPNREEEAGEVALNDGRAVGVQTVPLRGRTRYRVKRQIACKAIRDAARQELARRATEREKRKKYFCPHCSLPIPAEKAKFGKRIVCPECRESHICSEENYC